jgi:hypothetical protein
MDNTVAHEPFLADIYQTQNLEEINENFNKELDQFLQGKLEEGHIFKLGLPGDILQKTGFPEQDIELTAKRLKEKSTQEEHPFDPADLKNLVRAINEPVAVFSFGDKNKAQNIIIDMQQNGNNYLVGIHFNQEHRGTVVSDVRSLFPKETDFWQNWINQGKLLYANTEKLQAVVAQHQTNSGEVSRHILEPINNILQNNVGVKDCFPI